MAFCEKCGGQISEEMKFCDKCGSPVVQVQQEIFNDVPAQETLTEDVSPVVSDESDYQPVGVEVASECDGIVADKVESSKFSVKGFLESTLPANLISPGSKFFHWIGFGAFSLLALVYLIYFFVFMDEICTTVALETFGNINGSNPLWMIVYFVFNLSPIYFAYKSYKYEINKIPTLITLVSLIFVTVFMFTVWGISDAVDFMEAASVYAVDSPNVFAWFVLSDCLSELWYVKILLSVLSIFAFAINRMINMEQ